MKRDLDSGDNVEILRRRNVSFDESDNFPSRIRKTSLSNFRHLSTTSSSSIETPNDFPFDKSPYPVTFYEDDEVIGAAGFEPFFNASKRPSSRTSPCLSDLSESLFNTSTEEDAKEEKENEPPMVHEVIPKPTGNHMARRFHYADSSMIDVKRWKVPSRYRIQKVVGRGSYGDVAEAFDQVDRMKVAIKRMPDIFKSNGDAMRIYREMVILRNIEHPNIVKLKDVVEPDSYDSFNDLYLVFEFMDTDLDKTINSPQELTIAHVQVLIHQLLKGVLHLHSHNIIHRDIKPANILLSLSCELKLCDFGLARVVTSDRIQCCSISNPDKCQKCLNRGLPSNCIRSENVDPPSPLTKGNYLHKKPSLTRQLTHHVATRWYRAPELILMQDYTSAIDIWSVGCILAELLTMHEMYIRHDVSNKRGNHSRGMALFPGSSSFLSGASFDKPTDQLSMIFDIIGTPPLEVLQKLRLPAHFSLETLRERRAQNFEDRWPNAPAEALDLLRKMLEFSAAARISAGEALEHGFFSALRNGDDSKRKHDEDNILNAINVDVMDADNELKDKIYNELSQWH